MPCVDQQVIEFQGVSRVFCSSFLMCSIEGFTEEMEHVAGLAVCGAYCSHRYLLYNRHTANATAIDRSIEDVWLSQEVSAPCSCCAQSIEEPREQCLPVQVHEGDSVEVRRTHRDILLDRYALRVQYGKR